MQQRKPISLFGSSILLLDGFDDNQAQRRSTPQIKRYVA